jgi:hypothetical protein
MAYIGGSQAQGAKLGETDDTDWSMFRHPIRFSGLNVRSISSSPLPQLSLPNEVDGKALLLCQPSYANQIV